MMKFDVKELEVYFKLMKNLIIVIKKDCDFFLVVVRFEIMVIDIVSCII